LCSGLLRVSVAARVIALLAYRVEEACIRLSPSISLFLFTHSTVIGSTTQARGNCCKCGIDVARLPIPPNVRGTHSSAAWPNLWSSLTLPPPHDAGAEQNRG